MTSKRLNLFEKDGEKMTSTEVMEKGIMMCKFEEARSVEDAGKCNHHQLLIDEM